MLLRAGWWPPGTWTVPSVTERIGLGSAERCSTGQSGPRSGWRSVGWGPAAPAPQELEEEVGRSGLTPDLDTDSTFESDCSGSHTATLWLWLGPGLNEAVHMTQLVLSVQGISKAGFHLDFVLTGDLDGGPGPRVLPPGSPSWHPPHSLHLLFMASVTAFSSLDSALFHPFKSPAHVQGRVCIGFAPPS